MRTSVHDHSGAKASTSVQVLQNSVSRGGGTAREYKYSRFHPPKDNPNSLKYPISSPHLTNKLTMKVSILTIFTTFFALAVAGPVLGFAKRHRKPFRFRQLLRTLDHSHGDDGDDGGAPAQACDPPEGCVCHSDGSVECPH